MRRGLCLCVCPQVDGLVSNLKNTPTLSRVGEDDKAVHPW